ncbi:MAG: PEP-CTERM sorting domain-containing protein [Planctomycetota bacterium]|nr:PEP-CTERM sorting domain-containing protein [Planctomycetota bacterium]
MRWTMTVMAVGLALGILASGAHGYWDESMGHKMHYPQFPDPFGWDVNISAGCIVADDWKCSESGLVKDVHFWASWERDQEVPIGAIHVGIFSNVPETDTDPSHPGEMLWDRWFQSDEFSIHPGGEGDQGWYDPCNEYYVKPDHTKYFQVNIVRIKDPFIQKEGEIYWLALNVNIAGDGLMGWKTSRDKFMDDAAYLPAAGGNWIELIDPITGESLDMAFVITPEPGTITLMILGGLGMLIRRRRRR